MSWELWFLVIVYVLGFCGTFAMHTQMPTTLGLSLLRSSVWPAFWLWGWPRGERLPMD